MPSFSIKDDLGFLLANLANLSPETTDVTSAGEERDALLGEIETIRRNNPNLISNNYSRFEDFIADWRTTKQHPLIFQSLLVKRTQDYFSQVVEDRSVKGHHEDTVYTLNNEQGIYHLYVDYTTPETRNLFDDKPSLHSVTSYQPLIDGEISPVDFSPEEWSDFENIKNQWLESNPHITESLLKELVKNLSDKELNGEEIIFLMDCYADHFNEFENLTRFSLYDLSSFLNSLLYLTDTALQKVLALPVDEASPLLTTAKSEDEILNYIDWREDWENAKTDFPDESLEQALEAWPFADIIELSQLETNPSDLWEMLSTWNALMPDNASFSADIFYSLYELDLPSNEIEGFISACNSEEEILEFLSYPPEELTVLIPILENFNIDEALGILEGGYLPYLDQLKTKDLVKILKLCVDPEFISQKNSRYEFYMHNTYPTQSVLVNKYGSSQLKPSEIMAIIMIESGGNPRAHNSDGNSENPEGYFGLMQMGLNEFRSYSAQKTESNVFDPAKNIYAGSRYFAKLKERSGDSLAMAIASYNWGPYNVDKYLSGEYKGHLPQITAEYIAAFLLYQDWFDQTLSE